MAPFIQLTWCIRTTLHKLDTSDGNALASRILSAHVVPRPFSVLFGDSMWLLFPSENGFFPFFFRFILANYIYFHVGNRSPARPQASRQQVEEVNGKRICEVGNGIFITSHSHHHILMLFTTEPTTARHLSYICPPTDATHNPQPTVQVLPSPRAKPQASNLPIPSPPFSSFAFFPLAPPEFHLAAFPSELVDPEAAVVIFSLLAFRVEIETCGFVQPFRLSEAHAPQDAWSGRDRLTNIS